MEKETQKEIAPLTLRHLEEFRNEFRDFKTQLREDLSDVKFRLRQLEEVANHHTTQFDRIGERLTRIENRLDLVEA